MQVGDGAEGQEEIILNRPHAQRGAHAKLNLMTMRSSRVGRLTNKATQGPLIYINTLISNNDNINLISPVSFTFTRKCKITYVTCIIFLLSSAELYEKFLFFFF